MSRIVAFGASHSVGFNQPEWDKARVLSSACYPAAMAATLGYDLIHYGRVGVGVDYIDRTVLYDTTQIEPTDIAVVQLVSHYFFKTLFEQKTGRTFGAVTHYTSIDANPFSFKMATMDDQINLIDFMHNVNSIIETITTRYPRSVFFLCSPVRNFIPLATKIDEFGSDLDKKTLATFNRNLIQRICSETFEQFATAWPEDYCQGDTSHFGAKIHAKWGEYLMEQVR